MASSTLEDVTWDLEHLVDGEGPQGVDRQLAEAARLAEAFAERHAGRVAELDGPGLAQAMDDLAEIYELVGRAGHYASLRFAADTLDPANGALMQRAEEQGTAIETKLLFFDLEWAALDDDRAEELLSADGLDRFRHFLRTLRRYRPHLLSEPEEKVLTEKAITGRNAWGRLFSELMSAIQVELPDEDEPVELEVALSRLSSPTARCAARPPRRSRSRWSRACARVHTSSTRCSTTRRSTTACATTRAGSPAATSPTRRPTSRSRRSWRRFAPTTTSRSAGTASRRGCSASTAWPTTTAWRR